MFVVQNPNKIGKKKIVEQVLRGCYKDFNV